MKITAINNINKNIQYRNNNYNSVSVKYENTKNLTKDEFIHKSVKPHNPSFKGSDAYKFVMYNLENGFLGYTKEKAKLAQSFLVPFVESIRNPEIPVPPSILLHGSETNVINNIINRINYILSPLPYDVVKLVKTSKEDFFANIKNLLNAHQISSQQGRYRFITVIDEPENHLGMTYTQAKRLLNLNFTPEDIKILNENNDNVDNINYLKSLLDNCSKPAADRVYATSFIFTSKNPHLIHPDFRKGKMEKIGFNRPEDAGVVFLNMIKSHKEAIENLVTEDPTKIYYKNRLKNVNLEDLSIQQIDEIRNFFEPNYPKGAFSYGDIRNLTFDTFSTIIKNDERVPWVDCLYATLNNSKRSYTPEQVVRQMEISDLFEKRQSMYNFLKNKFENGDISPEEIIQFDFHAAVRKAQITMLEKLEKEDKLNIYDKYTLKKFKEEEL